jgi:predicted RecB family endonuclease
MRIPTAISDTPTMMESSLIAISIGRAIRIRVPHVSVAAIDIVKAKIGAKYHCDVTAGEALKYESAVTMMV